MKTVPESMYAEAVKFLCAYQTLHQILCANLGGSRACNMHHDGSDLDIRGIYIDPTDSFLGLYRKTDPVCGVFQREGFMIDIQINELGDALRLVLKGNGNEIEKILSSNQFLDTSVMAELRDLTVKSLSTRSYAHYRGFAHSCHRGLMSSNKSGLALKMMRNLMTATHLMRSGQMEIDIENLIQECRFFEVSNLLKKVRSGNAVLTKEETDYWSGPAWSIALGLLDKSKEQSTLPAEPKNSSEINAWLVKLRRSLHDL